MEKSLREYAASVVIELCEHEGAEGFSSGTRERVDKLLEMLSQPDPRDAEIEQATLECHTLAVDLYNQHFREDAPQWQPLPDLRGLISQIDNMTTGLNRATPHVSGWIIGNSAGDLWRAWVNGCPEWDGDRDKATRYARREDAEAVHDADEEAWRVEPYATPQLDKRDDEIERLREALKNVASHAHAALTNSGTES